MTWDTDISANFNFLNIPGTTRLPESGGFFAKLDFENQVVRPAELSS